MVRLPTRLRASALAPPIRSGRPTDPRQPPTRVAPRVHPSTPLSSPRPAVTIIPDGDSVRPSSRRGATGGRDSRRRPPRTGSATTRPSSASTSPAPCPCASCAAPTGSPPTRRSWSRRAKAAATPRWAQRRQGSNATIGGASDLTVQLRANGTCAHPVQERPTGTVGEAEGRGGINCRSRSGSVQRHFGRAETLPRDSSPSHSDR